MVYLLPGLTSAQRKAALRRLRQEGSRGCGPSLPAGQLEAALAADRLRVGVRSTAGAVRHHPVGMLVPAVLTGGLLAAFLFASVYAQEAAPSPGPRVGGAASWAVPAGAPGRGASPAPGRPPATRAAGQAGHPAIPYGGSATTKALPTP